MSTAETDILIGAADDGASARLLLGKANRHGLVTGATGTGKTVTLQVLTETFARHGVPVFCADVKGDLSGVAARGEECGKLAERAAKLGVPDYAPEACPAVFWDLFGELGHPVRTTVADIGPLLLARILDLNEAQEGVLNVAFRVAEDDGLLLDDLADVRAILAYISQRADGLRVKYGNVAASSVGAIQRRLLVLEDQGGNDFLGLPALDVRELLNVGDDGRGVVNILAAEKLMREAPRLYATFLLWLLTKLFAALPEVGDLDRPKLVFFFDEAHLLFEGAPKALVTKVEQVVRLIRSKGVGVYFVTQNPVDVPDSVASQLGNRVQHALRAYSPKEQKAVRTAAETFRPNPDFDTGEAITAMGVGEALASTLDANGQPAMVQRIKVCPPRSRMGPLDGEERRALIEASPFAGVYEEPEQRESAAEQLAGRLASGEAADGGGPAAAAEALPAAAAGDSRRAPARSARVEAARDVKGTVGRAIGRALTAR